MAVEAPCVIAKPCVQHDPNQGVCLTAELTKCEHSLPPRVRVILAWPGKVAERPQSVHRGYERTERAAPRSSFAVWAGRAGMASDEVCKSRGCAESILPIPGQPLITSRPSTLAEPQLPFRKKQGEIGRKQTGNRFCHFPLKEAESWTSGDKISLNWKVFFLFATTWKWICISEVDYDCREGFL